MWNEKKLTINLDVVNYFSGLYCVRDDGRCYKKNKDYTLDEVHDVDFINIINVSHYLSTILNKFMLDEHTSYAQIIRKYELRDKDEMDFLEFRKMMIRKNVEKIIEKNSDENTCSDEKEEMINEHINKILNFDFAFSFGNSNNAKLLKQYQDIIGKDLMLTCMVDRNRINYLPVEQRDFLHWYERKNSQKLINAELRRIYKLAQNDGYYILLKSIKEKTKSLLYATITFLANKTNMNIVIDEKLGDSGDYYLIFRYQEKKKQDSEVFQQQLDIEWRINSAGSFEKKKIL